MVLSSASSRSAAGAGVNRFYSPPALRRQLQQKQQQQQQEQQQQQQQQSSPPQPTQSEIQIDSNGSSSPPPPMPSGNLERFIAFTTPLVRAQFPPKKGLRSRRKSQSEDLEPFFDLADLWDSFREWSAYGAGVPLVLTGNENVVQYYVPYLSAIQLYVDRSRLSLHSSCQESSSERSNENGTGQLASGSRDSSQNVSSAVQEGFSGDDGGPFNQIHLPVFQYLEHDPPYGRQPLADKISSLANQFPELKTYRSCDLLPTSWISVAWYPIYRIPVGPTLRDLDACFLTFHSLSTSLNDSNKGQPELCSAQKALNANNDKYLSLPVFGLASYKFRHSIWISDGIHQEQLSSSLSQAAGNWLHLVKVNHPDYRFFLSHGESFYS